MGRRDFQSTVVDVLPRIIEQEAKSSVGSIKFSRKDKKTVGKLYLRGGLIYAIELNNYVPNIVNRIATNEYVSDSARQQILDRFGKSPKNFEVVRFVLTAQLFPEKPLMVYLKDYFLDAFDELFSWDQVNAEWQANDEPSVPTVPNVSPSDLLEKASLRKRYLEEKISPVWNSSPKAMNDLGFRKNYNFDNQDYTTALLLNVADGKWTIASASDYLGMSTFNVKKNLFELWQYGVIDILHPAGLIITNRSPQDIRNSSTNDRVSSDSKPVSVPELENMPEEVAFIAEPSAVSTPAVIQDISSPTIQKVNIVTDAPPSFSVNSPYSTQPVSVVPTQETVVSTPTDSTPVVPAPAASASATVNVSAGSRISQLAQQLKAEFAALDSNLLHEQNNRNQLVSYAQDLRNEKEMLLSKVAELDSKIQTADSVVALKDSQINQLNLEKAEINSMLKG